MASIREHRNKEGKLVSYLIRVHRGRGLDGKEIKPWTTTFDVSPTWTEKSARKKAEAFAANFEMLCKEGKTSNGNMKFAEYAEYVIKLKEERGVKHTTIQRYRELTGRIYPAIGHMKLKDIRADQLNDLYSKLLKTKVRNGANHAVAKIDFASLLKKEHMTRAGLAEETKLSIKAVYAAVNGEPVSVETAEAIAKALGISMKQSFDVKENRKTLSPKTVLEHHRLIRTILDQAEKEGLVSSNAASKATLPKQNPREVNYFQPEEISEIRNALESEPIKWKTITHLFLITGARRGEILGLKWNKVDWAGNRIHICNTILYTAARGIFEETPKTRNSIRYVTLPEKTMQLLREYQAWQDGEKKRFGKLYTDQGFVFTQDNGKPMHPDSVNDWLVKFSKRHELPHINPHAFRHSMASLLYFNGMDSVSISKRLGHAQVSTTANIYAHVMEEADKKNADILADVFLQD